MSSNHIENTKKFNDKLNKKMDEEKRIPIDYDNGID